MIRPFVLAAALVPALPAQQNVCITGIVQPVTGPTICMQGETHRLEDTRVFLRSSTVKLAAYAGKLVRIEGRDVGLTCTVLDVARVTDPATARLEWCGSGSTCCPIKLKVCPIGLGRGFLWLSPFAGYLPLGCANTGFLTGTVLLGQPILPVAQFTAGLCGEVTLSIPCDNALVGARVSFQGARQDIGPMGPLELTNVVTITISPFLPPCAPTGC